MRPKGSFTPRMRCVAACCVVSVAYRKTPDRNATQLNATQRIRCERTLVIHNGVHTSLSLEQFLHVFGDALRSNDDEDVENQDGERNEQEDK